MEKNTNGKMSLVKLIEQFHSEDACRAYLEKLRWPNGVTCPRCSSKNTSRILERNQYDCSSCRYQFSATSGTIFHDSHLPLWKWFLTAYIMVESKKGVSANQIKRAVDVSYKTAWYLCHRIRSAMAELNAELLRGEIEVDETLIGGTKRGVRQGYRDNKTIVIGIVQRGGKVRLQVIGGADRKTLHGFIQKHTAPDTEVFYTDDWPAYRGLADHDTRHETVNHSEKEWVRGEAHTNTIENVWSLLKRSVVGTYHKISAKHLDAYLDELEWRYNNRKNPWLFRDTLCKLISSERVQFQELIAS